MSEAVLELRDVTKRFEVRGGEAVVAVDGVSFTVEAGSCVALVGESGCGKSTIAQMVCGLEPPTSGSVVVAGHETSAGRGAGFGRRAERRGPSEVQMVFQHPQSSFDPRRTLGDGVCEPLRIGGASATQARTRAAELFSSCGLGEDLLDRYPSGVSGGQCQRAAIARALAADPRLIVCDEPTSALDVTVQAQMLDLLRDVRAASGVAYLFICHDLALVQGFCERVLVMRRGKIVEEGPAEEVLFRPRHPYTRDLIRMSM